MAARLRKTFHYPTEDAADSDSDREELDEQEQETLIQDLTQRDLDNTIFYRRAFTALPAAAALIYLPVLFSAETFRQVLLALLSLSSLAGTVYILLYVHSAPAAVDSGSLSAAMIDSRGPLDVALPWLNAALTAVLALSGVLAWNRDLMDQAWRAFLPASLTPSSTPLLDIIVDILISSHLPRHNVRSLSACSTRCRKFGTSQVQLQGCLILYKSYESDYLVIDRHATSQ